MNRTVRDRTDRHPKPVKRIELLENHSKGRLILTIFLILIGAGALGYSLIGYLTADAGWTTIEADSSEPNCSDELIFQYDIGAGELSATAEKKAVSALYTETTKKAYQLFHTSMSFDGVMNLYEINRHPNEEIVVEDVLYQAFSLLEKHGNRAIYLAPVYVQYQNLFGCKDDVETVDFDPYQNEEMAAYFAEISAFAQDEHAVRVELLGENRIKLFVSEAYLSYASEAGFSDFIDFYWMKNAFIVDFLAEEMPKGGKVAILMGEREKAPETFKLRRLENVPKTNYELAFDNLCENLWHQMSFYPATWLALPYLARLMEGWEREKDLKWVFRGIMAAGSFLATDVYGDRPDEEDIYESYRNAGLRIRAVTIDFLAGNLDCVREKAVQWRREFAMAVTAILGEQKLAYMLSLSGFNSYYIVCPECENCDEDMEVGYFELSERMKRAKAPSGKWDGRSLEDVRLWLPNLFNLLEDEEGEELLAYYFGTYVCPECGKKTPVLTGMEGYYFGE